MADNRITKSTAELVAIPPSTWYVKKISWLLEQSMIKDKIKSVPVNEKLLESLKKHRMINPILVTSSWYPIVGSQRIRACMHIKEEDPENPILEQEIRVDRLEKDYWNMYYLWGDEDFRAKAIAIWFQTVELAWKSMHYIHEIDFSGTEMREFERIGDELQWDIPKEHLDKFKGYLPKGMKNAV